MSLIVVVLGLIPLVWSGAVYALHAGASRSRKPHVASMRLEAAALMLMIAPVVIGGALLASPPLPVDSPIPVIDLPEISWEPAGVVELRVDAVAPAPSAGPSWPLVSLAILAIYLAGLAICADKLARARLRLNRIARKSVPALKIADRVRLTDEAFSPFASACGAIILPRTLAETLPPGELALIVEHERAHLDRGDPRAFWALACVDALFWFNPFVRRQTDRCRLAAELACDAAVVAAEPGIRAAYAAALVAAVRHASADSKRLTPATVPGILSGRRAGEHRLRLTHIMNAEPRRRGPLARMAVAVTALLVVPVGALQLAACATGATPANAGSVVAAPADFVIVSNPSDFVITAANEDQLVVERAENRITLAGALALDSGDGTVTFEQVDVFFSGADGRSRVERIFSPRAVLTHVPSPTGVPSVVLQANFTPCGGTLSLPAGLGQFPMGPENCSTGLTLDAGTVRMSDLILEVTAEGGAPAVERIDETLVRLTGALRIRTADGEYLTDRADIQFTPAEQGQTQKVLRVAALDAQVIWSSEGQPSLLTDDPTQPGRPVQTGTTVFISVCGGEVSLPELGRFETACPARAALPQRDAQAGGGAVYSATPLTLEVLPVEGRVTAAFGPGIDLLSGEERNHTGVDIAAPRYAPVVAPAAGRVTFVGWRGGYGRVVELDHGGDVKSRYAHLQIPEVSEGDEVAAGQLIGRVGATGRSSGDHMHWEIWHGGVVFDPEPMMAALAAR